MSETKTCPIHGARLDFVRVGGTIAYLRCPHFRDPFVFDADGVGHYVCEHEEGVPCGRLPAYGYPTQPVQDVSAWRIET